MNICAVFFDKNLDKHDRQTFRKPSSIQCDLSYDAWSSQGVVSASSLNFIGHLFSGGVQPIIMYTV